MGFDTISEYEEKLSKLEGIESLLHFDKTTGMPKKAVEQRGGQIGLINTHHHNLLTSDELYEALQEADDEDLDFVKQKRVERLKKDVKKARSLSESWVEEFSELTSEAESVWEEAREEDDYEKFKPYLKKLISMKKEYADKIDSEKEPYNVLLDDFEEGMTKEKLTTFFDELKPRLISLLDEIKQSKEYERETGLENKEFDIDKQREMANDVAESILKDTKRYQIRESAHPFTIRINPDDVRITTRVHEDNLYSIVSTVHESGHALYELGFDRDHWRTVLADAPSFGIHESQSRFWENHVFLDRQYLKGKYEEMKDRFDLDVSFEAFYKHMNRVEPGLIRVEADEVTYTLHVIIRFEIEKALFEGNLDVEELPKAWNNKYEEYLGVSPESDAEGVLQDVHWSHGSFGYFASYSLGSVYASMLAEEAEEDIDGFVEKLEDEEFDDIRAWLKKNIHEEGRLYQPENLIEKVTGSGLDADTYMAYLREKFLEIY